MSSNDFDQTAPLPVGDVPDLPQPASASDETATLPSGVAAETKELPVSETAESSPVTTDEAVAESSDSPTQGEPFPSSSRTQTHEAPKETTASYGSNARDDSEPDTSTAWTSAVSGGAASSYSVHEPIIPPARVWSAEDLKEMPYRGVRIGQLVWACIVIFTGVVLIAMAFVQKLNFAFVAITTMAVLGVLLIIIAGVSSVKSRKKRTVSPGMGR